MPSSPRSVAVGDFNGDGNLDLVSAIDAFQPSTLSLLLGHGDGTFGEQTELPVSPIPHSVAVGDLNGDGRSDLVAALAYANVAAICLNQTLPSLDLSRLGDNVKLSWPAWPGFSLESSTNLCLANGWSFVPDQPVAAGGQNALTNSLQSGCRYYRLKKL